MADLLAPIQRESLCRRLVFERHPENPVLPPDAGSVWECGCAMNPWVRREGDSYHLYYAGADANGKRRICHASAPVAEPTRWTRHGVLLERGPAGDFDSEWVVLPHVVRVGERWHLYYTGRTDHGRSLAAFPGLGLAVSTDGLTWERHPGNPVIAPSGIDGDPDALGIAGGSVVEVDGEYRFYYTGCPTVGDTHHLDQQKTVCLAVSRDGVAWEKRGMVMSRIPDRDYVDVAAAGPVVWRDGDGLWRMIYSAIGSKWGFYSICYAESDDGLVWRRGEAYGDDLVLAPHGNGWESQMVEYPSLVREGDGWRLFYCGNGYGATGIGTAFGREETT